MAGIFGDLFGSRGGILGGYPLEADPQGGYNSIGGGADEAMMAQRAREAAALRMSGRRNSRGSFDLSLLDPSDPAYGAAAGASQAPPAVLPWLWNQQGGAPAMPGSPQMGALAAPPESPMGLPAQPQPTMPGPAQAPIFPGMSSMGQAAGYGAGMDAPQRIDQAQLPPNATPTIGQGGAPVPQQQAAPVPGSPGVFDRLGAGLQGFANGGGSLSGSLEALFGGLGTGQRQDAEGLMERALISKGLEPAIARAAVKNPMLLQSVMPAMFGTKLQPVQIGQDALGHPIHGTFNALTGKYYDIAGREITGSNPGGGLPGGISTADANYNEQGRDEAFMKSLEKNDPTTASAVKAVVEGRMPATGRNLQQLLPIATRYDQNFTGTQDYATRMNTAKAYTSGEGARGLRSAGTAITHAVQLDKAIEDLHNFTLAPGVTNRVTGEVQRQYDPKYQAALKSFQVNSELFSKELDFALTGKSTVSGQEHIRTMFSPWASPEENKASLVKTLEMLNGRLEQHAHTYNQGMKSMKQPLELLQSKDAAALNKLIGGGHAEPAQGTTATTRAGGLAPGTYNWTPQSGAQ